MPCTLAANLKIPREHLLEQKIIKTSSNKTKTKKNTQQKSTSISINIKFLLKKPEQSMKITLFALLFRKSNKKKQPKIPLKSNNITENLKLR